MKITWIGHSCFKIEHNNMTVITDPYAPGSVPGLNDVQETADAVFCSHEHFDHNYREGVALSGSELLPTVTQIQSWHDDCCGAKRGANTIRIFDFGDRKIAHLGDIGCNPTPEQMAQLKGLDIIMIPVGGNFTIDGDMAAELIRELNPRIVIPMHYRNDELGFGFDMIDTADSFLNKCGFNQVRALASIEVEPLLHAFINPLTVIMTPEALNTGLFKPTEESHQTL